LNGLSGWDPGIAPVELKTPHYASERENLEALKAACSEADKAVDSLRQILQEERKRNTAELPLPSEIPPALTPADIERIRYYDKLEYRIGEDLRGALYGAGLLRFTFSFLNYHYALLSGKDGDEEWEKLRDVASSLNEMYVPVTYESTTGFRITDALSRTQLRQILTRCRGERKKAGKII